MTYKVTFALTTLISLFLMIIIATKFNQFAFIRFFLGDVLVTICIYAFLRLFLKLQPIILAIVVLLFSYSIEFLQMAKLLSILGLENNRLASVILGSTFDIKDLLAYTLGVLFITVLDDCFFWKKFIQNKDCKNL